MPDVLQTLGNTNWLLIVATKILEIGWMLLKTSTGGNPMWTTSSTSAGFECKLTFVYIFCHLFTFHFFFTPVPNGARHFLAYRLDSTLRPGFMEMVAGDANFWNSLLPNFSHSICPTLCDFYIRR